MKLFRELLNKDIDVQACEGDADHGAEQAHGDDQNHREGKTEAFVLRRQDEEDENDGEREDNERGVPRENLKQRELGPLEIGALRQLGLRRSRPRATGVVRGARVGQPTVVSIAVSQPAVA